MHRPVEDSGKDAAQTPPQLWISGTVEMWITGGGALARFPGLLPRPVPGRPAAGQLAVRASAAAARDKHAQGVHNPGLKRGRRPARPAAPAIGAAPSPVSSCPGTCSRRTAAVIPDAGEEITASRPGTPAPGTTGQLADVRPPGQRCRTPQRPSHLPRSQDRLGTGTSHPVCGMCGRGASMITAGNTVSPPEKRKPMSQYLAVTRAQDVSAVP